MDQKAFLEPLAKIARDAGEDILAVYDTDFDVEAKGDDSPLTEADLASHRRIIDGLANLTPDIPVLSEESADIPWSQRQAWDRYWLVDPLDGTKEFVKKNGEFTVNIALIEHGEPVIGVVHVPVTNRTYLGCVGVGAFVQDGLGSDEPNGIEVQVPMSRPPRAVASRSHQSAEVQAFLERLGPHEIVSMGSSLKLCLVAEGRADIYPRLGPTCEWDTAAAHAVVAAAGGKVINAENGEPLRYNQKESLLNPFFLVYGDESIDWFGLCKE
ncbi:MAG: 3'(2'),5'-bisphosphate nucleotidase CysQ [Gammaproteobacteria bacterium]|nr:3'(2'),5'-bisphosphate nucleotidase CysQ [Gammaproteobacteria bacterium]